MFFETQIHPLRFISHFLKCSLRLKSILWDSYPIFQNVLWDSNPSFEIHIPFLKMFFETQIHPLSFISHFPKCVLRLKSILWVSYPIFQNVLWDSNPLFEVHIPLSNAGFNSQTPYKWSFDSQNHVIWLSDPSKNQPFEVRKWWFEIWDLRFWPLEVPKIFTFCHMCHYVFVCACILPVEVDQSQTRDPIFWLCTSQSNFNWWTS